MFRLERKLVHIASRKEGGLGPFRGLGAALAATASLITTTGRRAGQPRRIEIAFCRFEDSIYLSGIPTARPRAWLLNLTADLHFLFHLKHGVVADLPAVATVIADPAERRRVFASSPRS